VPSAPGRRLPSSEEITVTARKREENLQSTPVAISAFSEADLEEQDIRSVQEITKSVPNLQFDTAIGSGNSARIYLRGVGNGDPLSSDDPVDGIYVDGVYYPRAPDAPVVGSAPPAAAPAGPSQLESPITLLPPSAERLRELEGERGNDMAEVLPALGSATMDPCAEPERVGAAVPAESAEEATRATRCRTVER
jgi:hypothetical protein